MLSLPSPLRTALALALALPSAALAHEPDLHAAAIDVGRFGVMLGQIAEQSASVATDPEAPITAAAIRGDLAAQIWAYNAAREDLCRGGFVRGEVCAAPYVPRWLAKPSRRSPAAGQIEAEIAAFSEVIVPFWEAVCAEGAKRGQTDGCPIE
jgi:hypothetical protein